jgi:hypothetical protein
LIRQVKEARSLQKCIRVGATHKAVPDESYIQLLLIRQRAISEN